MDRRWKSLLGYRRRAWLPEYRLPLHWNMLPIGQLLWYKELFSYKEFPPMQAPVLEDLDGILKQMQQSWLQRDHRPGGPPLPT